MIRDLISTHKLFSAHEIMLHDRHFIYGDYLGVSHCGVWPRAD